MVPRPRLKGVLKSLLAIKQTGLDSPSNMFKQISWVDTPASLPDFQPHSHIPKFNVTDYPYTQHICQHEKMCQQSNFIC